MDAAILRRNDAQFCKQIPGSNHRMTGKLELFFCREDAQPRESFFVCRFLHENSLRKIHFASDGKHLVVGESISVGKHGERVAFEAVAGENIESVETVFHGWS